LRKNIKPVVIITGPEKESLTYPSSGVLNSIFSTIAEADIEEYKDDLAGLELMDFIPEPGTIVDESYDETADFYIWKLSNNSKVIFKHTDFKNNEVLFSAFSPGGTSLIEDSEYLSSTVASNLIQRSGLGDFDVVALEKILAGKRVSVSPYISTLYEGFSGSCVTEDTEILFQLLNLHFTGLRRSDIAYDSFMNRMEGLLANRESIPEVVFQDAVKSALYDNHFRSQPLTVSRLTEIDEVAVYDIFQERFANPSDFIFFFVGNIPQNFPYLVETYIASIPESGELETWIDRDMSIEKGVNLLDIHVGIEQKSSVNLIFSGSYDWTLENNTALYALRDLLDIRLREELREESSGTYGVGVSTSLRKFPMEEYTFSIYFSCDPFRVEELTDLVFEVIDEVKTSLADNENVIKIKEGFRRTYEESIRENSYWLALMDAVFRYGLESRYLLDKPARNDAVSAAMMRDAAVKYLDTDNYFKAVLYPHN
jgi:zinc protease